MSYQPRFRAFALAYFPSHDTITAELETFSNNDCRPTMAGVELKVLGDRCYDFIDTNVEPEGVYSAMYVEAKFNTDIVSVGPQGGEIVSTQTTGPLVLPNTYPFSLCPDDGEVGSEIDCSDALDGGIENVSL